MSSPQRSGLGERRTGGEQPASGPRRLNLPRAARVRADRDGTPIVVDGHRIEARRESWLVEDRWWTERPLRRRYWELVSDAGRDIVVFHDLVDGHWYTQR